MRRIFTILLWMFCFSAAWAQGPSEQEAALVVGKSPFLAADGPARPLADPPQAAADVVLVLGGRAVWLGHLGPGAPAGRRSRWWSRRPPPGRPERK